MCCLTCSTVHALTGCDFTSSLSGICMKKAFKNIACQQIALGKIGGAWNGTTYECYTKILWVIHLSTLQYRWKSWVPSRWYQVLAFLSENKRKKAYLLPLTVYYSIWNGPTTKPIWRKALQSMHHQHRSSLDGIVEAADTYWYHVNFHNELWNIT